MDQPLYQIVCAKKLYIYFYRPKTKFSQVSACPQGVSFPACITGYMTGGLASQYALLTGGMNDQGGGSLHLGGLHLVGGGLHRRGGGNSASRQTPLNNTPIHGILQSIINKQVACILLE